MKKISFCIICIGAFIIAACGGAGVPEAVPTVMLAGGAESSSPQPASGDTVAAAAVVVPLRDANLSFASIGRVSAVHVQAGDQVAAGDVLVELDTSILEAKVREAEANLRYAEIQLSYLTRNVGCRGEGCAPSYQHIEVAEIDVARAQALLDSARATLDAQAHLTAPMAGVVVSVSVSPAETVSPGQVVVIVGDLSQYRIETTDLSERDVTRVKVGQPASVFIEALGEEFSGTVADVARISSELGGDVVYTVTVALDEQPAGLLWGMSADVEIGIGD